MTKSKRASSRRDDLFDDLDFNVPTSGGSVLDFDYGYGKKGGYGGKSSYKYTPRCYESHPAMPLPGTELVVYGGSCSNPKVKDADVYIGFDGSMKFSKASWPWTKGDEVFFKITDMSVPDDAEAFKKLVAWAKGQVEAGLKVHAGCIGGHGRTGMFLAALVSMYGETDAITYVRKHYCQKAVESAEQVKFLGKHFGIKPAKGTKSSYSGGKGYSSTSYSGHGKSIPKGASNKTGRTYEPVKGFGSIWDQARN